MPSRFIPIAILAASVLTIRPASAQEDCFDNVWRGTIGKAAITMEFNTLLSRDRTLRGRYYYGASLSELALMPSVKHQNVWEERDAKGRVTGLLSLSCRGNRLTGKWTRTDGSHAQSLTATEVAPDSYRLRQWAALPIRIDKRVALDQHKRYERISAPGIAGVQGVKLLGAGRGIAAINRELSDMFRAQLDNVMSCHLFGLMEAGPNHGFEETYVTDVLAYGEHLVVIGQFASTACGGVPSTGQGARTFRLADGAEEDVGHWLRQDWAALSDPDPMDMEISVQDAGEGPAPNALARFINERSSEDSEECRDVVTTVLDDDHVWPGRDGIHVRPEATVRSSAWCATTFVIPYDFIWPYFTENGRRQAEMMKRSLPLQQKEDVSRSD